MSRHRIIERIVAEMGPPELSDTSKAMVRTVAAKARAYDETIAMLTQRGEMKLVALARDILNEEMARKKS